MGLRILIYSYKTNFTLVSLFSFRPGFTVADMFLFDRFDFATVTKDLIKLKIGKFYYGLWI